MTREPSGQRAFAALRQLVRPRGQGERCELCSALVAAEHEHLIEPAVRRLVCCCRACAILFSGPAGGRYRRVPHDVELLDELRLDDARWEELHLPINLAFFFFSTPTGRVVAVYPSPAGAMESLLTLEAWRDLEDDSPALRRLEPDVEALLVNRVGATRAHYRVPIDVCYQLVGLIRTKWRGLSGGPEVWEAITQFFTGLRDRSSAARGAAHA